MTAEGGAQLARIISPLRRNLLRATRAAAGLPDLPDAQIEIIRALLTGNAQTPGDLAALLGLRRSTVSNLLLRMESTMLISRRTIDGDARRVHVEATERAERLFASFDAASAAIVEDALANLDQADRDAVLASLTGLERLAESFAEVRTQTKRRNTGGAAS